MICNNSKNFAFIYFSDLLRRFIPLTCTNPSLDRLLVLGVFYSFFFFNPFVPSTSIVPTV